MLVHSVLVLWIDRVAFFRLEEQRRWIGFLVWFMGITIPIHPSNGDRYCTTKSRWRARYVKQQDLKIDKSQFTLSACVMGMTPGPTLQQRGCVQRTFGSP